MKKIPITELKHTNTMDLRDMLREGVLLVTQHGKPLAEMWPPGEVDRLLKELEQLVSDDNEQNNTVSVQA